MKNNRRGLMFATFLLYHTLAFTMCPRFKSHFNSRDKIVLQSLTEFCIHIKYFLESIQVCISGTSQNVDLFNLVIGSSGEAH